MSPADISDMTLTSSSNQTLTIPKLQVDGSNWSTYSERVMNYLTLQGLKKHVLGTAHRLVNLVERDRNYYNPGALSLLNDEELEKHEKEHG
jgi:hypothetical protein